MVFSIRCRMKSSVARPAHNNVPSRRMKAIVCPLMLRWLLENVTNTLEEASLTYEDWGSLCDLADVIISLHHLLHPSS